MDALPALVRRGVSADDAAAADRITDLCDRVSFDFCLEEPDSGAVDVLGRTGAGTRRCVRPRRARGVALDPWPLDRRARGHRARVRRRAAPGRPRARPHAVRPRADGGGADEDDARARLPRPGRPPGRGRPEPAPAEGEVLLQVEVALTDGTDLKAYRRGHPVLLGPPPSPFGHEVCGIDVATGRRVVVANSAPCGACPPCARGRETLCENLFPLLNGAYAELLLVPGADRAPEPPPRPAGLASEVAAMAEPLACCLHGLDVAGVQHGDTVAIVGAGPIGLMLCACVADAGGRPVVVGGRPERRELRRSSAPAPPSPRAPTS